MKLLNLLLFALAIPALIHADATTQVLKWKDGKKAAFMLAFDDSAPSQLKNVVPELEKREIVGNFYLVTGNKLYASLQRRWEAAAKSPYVAIANHTFTHKGVNNAAELDPELAKCNEVLYTLKTDRTQPYLLGFGKPGGVPWKVTEEEWNAALAKHNLCNRPPFAGPPINYKSAEQTIATVDAAIAKGEMGHLDFHGVGEDWLVTPVEWFTALLDKLESVRDVVWITDVVSWHQYVTERDSAEVKTLKADLESITLELSCKADPKLYNLPLTLSTSVPADWKSCTVTQGASSASAAVVEGAVKYDALPGGGEIVLKKAP
ncbi:polysaccharide deacetylase family protein [Brevifollis gellanilyticus]|uniref:NodB homology domain-containing protein n=1 Tax=Brevifollis gellanilyticus TaxID=748831 RepID=A0A512MGU3_9BACT|nr:polysaccharide deacetylase family protein [Brevifollis gellanilyticus]GEP45967.1 hypothetical protein BGE01nite_52580 [Brevifollis gellanilyticus]